jgi:ankyrin repeat protein
MDNLTFTQEEANQFIIECHNDLEAVKEKVSRKPTLVNAFNPELNETALGAAGHMGRRDIVEFLLSNGAILEFATAAMLGRREVVAERLAKNPKLAFSGGAHGIPVAYHAAMSGDTEIMQMLWEAGAEEQIRDSLIGAVNFGHVEMVRWLLEHGARRDVKAFNGLTPLEIAERNGMTEIANLLAATT